jgi:hypothetical protein
MPSTKISAATIAGAIGSILVWLLHDYAGVNMPDGVAAAVVLLISVLIAYFVPETNPSPSAVEAVRAGKGAAAPPS